MLGVGLAGVDADPLDPGFDVFVDIFRASLRIAMLSDQPLEIGQLALGDIVINVLEVEFVYFEQKNGLGIDAAIPSVEFLQIALIYNLLSHGDGFSGRFHLAEIKPL